MLVRHSPEEHSRGGAVCAGYNRRQPVASSFYRPHIRRMRSTVFAAFKIKDQPVSGLRGPRIPEGVGVNVNIAIRRPDKSIISEPILKKTFRIPTAILLFLMF